MPLVYRKNLVDHCILGIWEITETEQYFLDQLVFWPEEQEYLNQIKGRKRVEWLAVRQLVHTLSERDIRGPILKDEYGKPYLKDSSFFISMSHTKGFAAVIAAPYPVGVDIQERWSSILRLKNKFVGSTELSIVEHAEDEIGALHILWGTKEGLYKAYGRRKIDFKMHLFVDPFEIKASGGFTTAHIRLDNFQQQYDVHYELFRDIYFVYVRKKENSENENF